MNGVERRLSKLEAPSREGALAEAGRAALYRLRAGNGADEDVALIARPGALAGLSDAELETLVEEARLKLRSLEEAAMDGVVR
jgi:hypothetical protein